jgi:hypothetical protein
MTALSCANCRQANLPDEHGDAFVCQRHGTRLKPAPVAADPPLAEPAGLGPASEPVAGAPPEESTARCWNCRGLLDDPDADRCRSCDAELPGPPLSLHFDVGVIKVERGRPIELGRSPATAHSAILSADTVSRRHAAVWVDEDDHAWIRPGDTTNGTWLRGQRLTPGSEVRLTDGDVLGLGREVRAKIVVQRWPA